jgi:DNA repair photolyase
MKHPVDRIWIRSSLEKISEVQHFLSNHSQIPVTAFEKIQEIEVHGANMAEKIDHGKRVLVLSERSGSLLGKFENHDDGSVCPDFHKLVPSTNCPYGCQYCFLSATYRACRPFQNAYVIDLEKLERDLRKMDNAADKTTIISAGEMSDPLACDYLGYMPRIVELFGTMKHLKFLLLSKSGRDEIQALLPAKHAGRTITSWSLTCDEVVERYEARTEPIESRLTAAKAAQDAGYEVRFRLDPFLLLEGWQAAYARTIDSIYATGIRPSRITLGSFRLLGSLGGIIKARFPESDLMDQPLQKEAGKRKRYPQEIREEFYIHAIAQLREHNPSIPIALCKETPEMHQAFEGLVDETKCNCLP